jgi:hypothetical protein
MSVSDFYAKFDPSDSSHVEWFSRMNDVANDMSRHNLLNEVNKNPMNIVLDETKVLEWAQIHCLLGLKYAKAVISKNAHIPA